MRNLPLRNAALGYADRGWHVLPCRGKLPHGRLVPKGRNGEPGGLSLATDDLATVLDWWTRDPRANIGIVAKPSGLLILDVDPRHGGDDSLHDLERELGRLPETVRAETGGGGEHLILKHPGGDFRAKVAEGVDIRDQAYIIAPPSLHPETRRRYEWDLAPEDIEPADIPEAWLERMRPVMATRRDRALNVRTDHDDPLRCIPAGIYVPRLTGRKVTNDGFAQCPFHKGGRERTPSLKVEGTLWSCFGACEPIAGKQYLGGNIYDLAGLLADFPIPLRGPDFLDVQAQLSRTFEVAR
jgi:hypothetical protein